MWTDWAEWKPSAISHWDSLHIVRRTRKYLETSVGDPCWVVPVLGRLATLADEGARLLLQACCQNVSR